MQGFRGAAAAPNVPAPFDLLSGQFFLYQDVVFVAATAAVAGQDVPCVMQGVFALQSAGAGLPVYFSNLAGLNTGGVGERIGITISASEFLFHPAAMGAVIGAAAVSPTVVIDSTGPTFDATTAVNNILQNSGGVAAISFVAGKTYNFSAPITLQNEGVFIVNAAGALLNAQFGAAWATPLFRNNKAQDLSHTLILNEPTIRGNCVAVDMRYSVANPPKGLNLTLRNLDFNTNDGNRRAGTCALLFSHMDFLDVTKTKIYNVDQVAVLGAASPSRNSTQLTLRNIMAGQVNAGVLFRGCDKVNIIGADIANCNNGFSFEGNNRQIYLNQCHVEGLARAAGSAGAAYNFKSSYVHASSEATGYNFVDDADNRNIILTQCSIIDLQTTGGTAKHGVRVGVSNYSGIVDVEFKNCTIPETCEGASTYRPIRAYAPIKWRGPWKFTASSEMSDNGLGYLDHDIQDSDNNYAPRANLLGGDTVLSLRAYPVGAPPTVTEVAQGFNPMYISHRVVFNSIGFLSSNVNLPVGWCTLDVVGQRIAGNVLLRVELNGAPFTRLVNVQYKSLNDTFHRTRICFFNPTPNQSYNVGLASQNASGDESVFSYIACYAGLPDGDIRVSNNHTVAALPAPSIRWWRSEAILVASGATDRHYRCVRLADGATYAWRELTLT
jgi:predicted RecA/RadA family phage recombinase